MRTQPRRTCRSCGNEFSGPVEFCPVCILRKALAGGVESGKSFSGDTLTPTSKDEAHRFEHYELVCAEDGTPVERFPVCRCDRSRTEVQNADIHLAVPDAENIAAIQGV